MYLKVHRIPGAGDVVAVCDRELLNSTLLRGDVEVCISEAFYGTSIATEDEVRRELAHAENVNLMGRRAVDLAVRMGLIEESGCIMIGCVPHAQIFRI
ncbi:MAG: DUF424 domain-containing protein [Methanomicrobiaceae archaeon]|nr:DUF424 domain-containing protein [Methanomicrobiaceae archaeon]